MVGSELTGSVCTGYNHKMGFLVKSGCCLFRSREIATEQAVKNSLRAGFKVFGLKKVLNLMFLLLIAISGKVCVSLDKSHIFHLV